MSVISSHEIPFRYALTNCGYAFAASNPIDRALPTRAARRHARSSAAVIGRRSLSVPGFGIGTRDRWCAGSGMRRVDRESVTMFCNV